MRKAFRIVITLLLLVIFVFCCAQAENSGTYYYLTDELSRIKTQHDNGFIHVESINPDDPHYGWGLGRFFLQGYSDTVTEKDGNPVFLIKGGNQIFLKFMLEQNIDQLNGRSDLRINEDSNGRDDSFGINGTSFGRGGLIIEKTDKNGQIQTETYANYLTAVSSENVSAQIGPLTEGNYRVALDYELQSGPVLPGYNDYKITFSFSIQNRTDFYATKASVTNGINLLHLQTGAIITAVLLMLIFVIFFILKRKRTGKPDTAGSIYNSINAEQESSIHKGDSRLAPTNKRILIVIVLLVIAILFITVIGPFLSKPTTYLGPIEYLTKKSANALAISAGSSAISIVITAMPGDTGTPIANKLADLAGYLVVVASIITAEKYFITTIGFIASTIVIPLSCLCMIICILLQHGFRRKLAEWSIRLFAFGICIALIIPLGCACGLAVDSIDKEAFDNALHTADQASVMIDKANLSLNEKNEAEIEKALSDYIKGNSLLTWANNAFTKCVTVFSKMLITTILLPVLMLIAFIWAVKILTKKDYSGPALYLSHQIAVRTSAGIRGTGKSLSKRINKRKEE